MAGRSVPGQPGHPHKVAHKQVSSSARLSRRFGTDHGGGRHGRRLGGEEVTEWQPIGTAPEGEPHVRGMWVYNAQTGKPIYFAANAGYVDDDGDFVSMDGDDDL